MCYKHVVNLSSGRAAEEATSTTAVDLDKDWSGLPLSHSPDQQSYNVRGWFVVGQPLNQNTITVKPKQLL